MEYRLCAGCGPHSNVAELCDVCYQRLPWSYRRNIILSTPGVGVSWRDYEYALRRAAKWLREHSDATAK